MKCFFWYDYSLEETRLGLVEYNSSDGYSNSATFSIIDGLDGKDGSISLQFAGCAAPPESYGARENYKDFK